VKIKYQLWVQYYGYNVWHMIGFFDEVPDAWKMLDAFDKSTINDYQIMQVQVY
jgi:hypothetical protein